MKKLIWILLFVVAAETHAATPHKAPTFGFVDLLYWEVRESGADNWGQVAVVSGGNTSYRVLEAPFNWNTGVKIGVGREFNQGSYDVTLAYTHYQASARNQATGTVISSFDGNYFVNNTNGALLDKPYNNANIRYQFFYNTVDLMLGRNYQLDSVLRFHPYVGIKAGSINQNIYSNWIGPIPATNFTAATEDLKNDFSGIGPTLGVDSNWLVCSRGTQSLDLVGNLVGGLLYGHTKLSDVYANNNAVVITIHNDSVNGASPLFGGLLALQWNSQFMQSDMSIRLGYEAQIWLNQVQFYSLNMGKINRPVTLQGANLEFRFNF